MLRGSRRFWYLYLLVIVRNFFNRTILAEFASGMHRSGILFVIHFIILEEFDILQLGDVFEVGRVAYESPSKEDREARWGNVENGGEVLVEFGNCSRTTDKNSVRWCVVETLDFTSYFVPTDQLDNIETEVCLRYMQRIYWRAER